MAKDIKHNKEYNTISKDIQTKVLNTTKSRTNNTMAKDIRQTKVLKHNKEQDIQYNSQRYKTNKSPKTQQRAGHTIQWPKI